MPQPRLTGPVRSAALAAPADVEGERRERVLLEGFAAVRAEHGVEVEHPAAARAAAAEAVRRGPRPAPREDARDLPLVTIDPVGSRDLDQAVHVARRGDGYRVSYAIADVAAFVDIGDALDLAAHERGETVYCPDVRAPLHPAELSEGAASLLPGEDRPAVLWTFDLDADGAEVGTRVRRAMVRSREQLDYGTVQARSDAAGVPRGVGAGVVPRGRSEDLAVLLPEVGSRRTVLERERGGVHLARPEQEVTLGAEGWTTTFRASLPVEEHNAQISLLTGSAAARLMVGAQVGILRTMPAARDEDLARLRRQAVALGVEWPIGVSYGDLLLGLDHSLPEVAAFLVAATRLFRGATWSAFDGALPEETRHGAMGTSYAHVTAPLRRLVDRLGLETCLAIHAGEEVPAVVRDALPGTAAAMVAGARRSNAVDRGCTDLVETVVLADKVGHVLDAVAVTDDTVQLVDPAVVARCEGELPVGDAVRVRLVEADPTTRSVRFVVA